MIKDNRAIGVKGTQAGPAPRRLGPATVPGRKVIAIDQQVLEP
jgi:hypothetical protein